MVRSMTGYGKAECIADNFKYTVEIKSVNGKSADISAKSSIIPRHAEAEVKQYIASELQRGTIDLYVFAEPLEGASEELFNKELLISYYNSILALEKEIGKDFDKSGLIAALIRNPEISNGTKKEISDEVWNTIFQTIKDATTALDEFRQKEGMRLHNQLLSHVTLIENYLREVELLDPERIANVKERLSSKLAELENNNKELTVDANRFEQELIYYLEKQDVTEEKVRLHQHCQYFRQTIADEQYCGKKLGFIAQEMGREINTLGSKASHAGIQRLVVMMKDELEKIKEQVLNVL